MKSSAQHLLSKIYLKVFYFMLGFILILIKYLLNCTRLTHKSQWQSFVKEDIKRKRAGWRASSPGMRSSCARTRWLAAAICRLGKENFLKIRKSFRKELPDPNSNFDRFFAWLPVGFPGHRTRGGISPESLAREKHKVGWLQGSQHLLLYSQDDWRVQTWA